MRTYLNSRKERRFKDAFTRILIVTFNSSLNIEASFLIQSESTRSWFFLYNRTTQI